MFEDVYLVDEERRLIDDAEIVAAEEQLGVTLPHGYHKFLTTLGHGTLCDRVYVFLPHMIQQKTDQLRKVLRESYFWDRGAGVLPREAAEETLLIARSLDGDELIWHPEADHGVYVLPRHDDTIYWLTPEFDDPLQWNSESGDPVSPPAFRYFEPAEGRACVELFTARTDHGIDSVADLISAELAGDAEVRCVTGDRHQLHFHKAVSSRVQLTMVADGRIGIRVDYNPAHEASVTVCVSHLQSVGFRETGRHVT